ncbi:MAG: transglycosylase domain-containing protein, partial [Selenomonadaceae bacterium]|nr:transglycosylase domain-containing protein [Selenomonadaceae bacterium]
MSEQPKKRRSFKFIIRFFQIVAALIFVFWASFFITLAIRSSHPIDYLFSYVEDFFGEEEKKPVTPTPTSTTKNPINNRTTDSRTSAVPVKNTEVGIVDRVGRIFSIEDAVNKRIRKIPHYVSLDDMPRTLQQAIVAVEDTRFYSHSGFDLTGIARAAVVNVEAGDIEEGASTI